MTALVAWASLIGALLAFGGEFRHFESRNPELFQRLQRR